MRVVRLSTYPKSGHISQITPGEPPGVRSACLWSTPLYPATRAKLSTGPDLRDACHTLILESEGKRNQVTAGVRDRPTSSSREVMQKLRSWSETGARLIPNISQVQRYIPKWRCSAARSSICVIAGVVLQAGFAYSSYETEPSFLCSEPPI